LDKAPDAFRTISEVADDLDIPQHVLRFWETRFVQIKPMKRSGGRRYYRPDDVDLLRGIRRLLYGEGYTIRGVQRILKEQGVKAVQGLIDGTALAPGVADDMARHGAAPHDEEEPDVEVAGDDDHDHDVAAEPADVARRPPSLGTSMPKMDMSIRPQARPPQPASPARGSGGTGDIDVARLKATLDDLVVCRQLLDQALGDS
jgi:DNA-binding transcriptional MerR regulator